MDTEHWFKNVYKCLQRKIINRLSNNASIYTVARDTTWLIYTYVCLVCCTPVSVN